MKRFTLLLILAALLAACDNASQSPPASLPTPLPPVPTASTDGQQPTAEQEPTATGAALATLPASPTAETPTEAPTLTPLPTDEPPPSPAASPTLSLIHISEPTRPY